MQKINWRGLFFIIIAVFGIPVSGFPKDNTARDLERIVIFQSKSCLLNPYTLESSVLESFTSGSPIEALSLLPLDLQSRSLKGGIQTDFSLRGSNFQGVLVLLNGQRINDPQTGHHNCDIPLTTQDLERIEVVSGAASSLFGTDSIGGAINFVLKKPDKKNIILESSFGSHQTKSGVLSISDKIDDLGVRFSLENQESRGFYDDTDFKKFTTTLSSSLDIPDGEFAVNFGYQEKEFGAYDFYTPKSGYPSKEWTKTHLFNLGLNLDKEGLIIRPNFLWRRHYDKFMLDKTLERSNYLNHHRTDVYTPNIYFQKQTGFLGELGLGLEYGTEKIKSTNLGKHSRNHGSIFMDNTKELSDRILLALSVRADESDVLKENCTGSANLRYQLFERDALRFGISRSIRLPSFTELYYNDPTTTGDVGLSAEKSLTYEAGYDTKKDTLSLGVAFFSRKEDDFVDWIKYTAGQAKWQAENIADAKVFGAESYLKLEMKQDLALDFNYTYIDKRTDDRGYIYKYGSNYIRHLVNTTLSFNLPFGKQTVGLTYKKKPRRNGWLILNMCLAYNLVKNTQVFINFTNLLNVEYQEIEGIPQPGRFIETGVRLEW